MKIEKIWILMQITFIMLTMFFTIFIPMVFGVGWFIIQVALLGHIETSLVLLPIMVFGALFISLAIVYRITFYYNELFKWNKKYENLEER